MNVTVKCLGFSLTEGLHNFIKERFRSAVARVESQILRIDITLVDINGPKGGKDKRCKAKISLKGRPAIIVQETCHDMYESISRCGNRSKRSILRKSEKIKKLLKH